MTPEKIAELRALRGKGMTSAVGEYTPDELWEALDEIERLRGIVPEVLEHLNDELCAENDRLRAALAAERERLCAAIKAADDKASEGDYMLDSDDCISVIRGTWNPGA